MDLDLIPTLLFILLLVSQKLVLLNFCFRLLNFRMDNKCVKVGTEEKGSHETIIDDFNNNSGVANLNDDNQILAAIMSSLQDA